MGAPDVLAQLSALGVTLSREGDALIARPRSALTDQARDMIRAHKQELLAALGSTGDAAEARRQWAIAMLAERPDLRVAVSVDSDGDPVRVAVAIRDKGT